MNNTIKFLLGFTAAGLAYTFLNKKKAALENLEIKKIDVYIDLPKTQQNFYLKLFYNLKINVFNSSSVKVNIKSIDANFFINGIEFAQLSSTLNAIVPSKENKDLLLAASVSSASVVNSIVDIITNNKAEIEVRGTLLTDLGLIEFTKKQLV